MIDTARAEPSSGCRLPVLLYWCENWYLALREVNVGLKEMKAVSSVQFAVRVVLCDNCSWNWNYCVFSTERTLEENFYL